MGEEWDDSLQSKEQIEASLVNKQEAAIRRERALAYAFSHQVLFHVLRIAPQTCLCFKPMPFSDQNYYYFLELLLQHFLR